MRCETTVIRIEQQGVRHCCDLLNEKPILSGIHRDCLFLDSHHY